MPYKLETKYGLVIGILTIAWIVGEFYLASALNRPDLGETTGFLASLIPIFGITLGIRRKKKEQAGILSFSQALKTGLLISLIAGLLTGIFVWIYFSWQTEPLEVYYSYLERSLNEKGLPAEEVASQMENARQLFTPRNQAATFVLSSLIAGLVISSVVGFFAKTKQPVQGESM